MKSQRNILPDYLRGKSWNDSKHWETSEHGIFKWFQQPGPGSQSHLFSLKLSILSLNGIFHDRPKLTCSSDVLWAVHRKAPSRGRSKPFARLIRIYWDIHPCQNVHECHTLIQTICKIEAWWKSLPREPFWQLLAPPQMQILSEGIFDH